MRNVFVLLFLGFFFLGNTQIWAQNKQDVQYGEAAYYADDFDGKRTAYDVKYDKTKLTAAHKSHPYGTVLKVTHLGNNRAVNVTVTDKGPYLKGRIIDLSRAAAEQIGLIRDGVAQVKVEVITKGKGKVAQTRPSNYDNTSTSRIVAQKEESEAKYNVPGTKTNNKPKSSSASKRDDNKGSISSLTPTRRSTPVQNYSNVPGKGSMSNFNTNEPVTISPRSVSQPRGYSNTSRRITVQDTQNGLGLYQIQLGKPANQGFAVQVAYLSSYENMMKQVAELQEKSFNNVMVSIERGNEFDGPNYRILLGPWGNRPQATNYNKNLKKKYKIEGFVVDLADLVLEY